MLFENMHCEYHFTRTIVLPNHCLKAFSSWWCSSTTKVQLHVCTTTSRSRSTIVQPVIQLWFWFQ